jgi:glutathione S-transferase
MPDLTIVIGNKNYSSWSMRPWLALKAAGLPFREVLVALRQPDTGKSILAYSPSGKVPTLIDGSAVVWESLAICEYVAELNPEAGLWPRDRAARAHARSIASEMHAGFSALRENLPMDLTRDQRDKSRARFAAEDIARIAAIWSQTRAAWGKAGPFLFGEFGIADCMFAPVVGRFRTYGVSLDASCEAYMHAVLHWPGFKEWEAAAAKETAIIEFDIFSRPDR